MIIHAGGHLYHLNPPVDDKELQAAHEQVMEAYAMVRSLDIVCIDQDNQKEGLYNHCHAVHKQLRRLVPHRYRGANQKAKDKN